MQLTTQVLARNTLEKHVVLSADAKGSDFIEWSAKGDPNGQDLQIVPEAIANSVAFLRLVNKGIVTIDDQNAPETIAAFDAQRAEWDSRSVRDSQAAQATIQRDQANDLVSTPCVGPSSRGQGACEEPVPVRERTKDDKPPLCPMHAALAPQYVPDHQQVGTENKIVWLRTGMTPRETAQSV